MARDEGCRGRNVLTEAVKGAEADAGDVLPDRSKSISHKCHHGLEWDKHLPEGSCTAALIVSKGTHLSTALDLESVFKKIS